MCRSGIFPAIAAMTQIKTFKIANNFKLNSFAQTRSVVFHIVFNLCFDLVALPILLFSSLLFSTPRERICAAGRLNTAGASRSVSQRLKVCSSQFYRRHTFRRLKDWRECIVLQNVINSNPENLSYNFLLSILKENHFPSRLTKAQTHGV